MTHTVTMHDGVRERIAECARFIATSSAEADAKTYEELTQALRQYLDRVESLFYNLAKICASTQHDGDVQITLESYNDKSFFFRYASSGYHGGLLYHPDTDKWQIHT